jgi:hypothetical protein
MAASEGAENCVMRQDDMTGSVGEIELAPSRTISASVYDSEELAKPRLSQIEVPPEDGGKGYRNEEPEILKAHVRGRSASEVAGGEDRPEHAGSRDQVQDHRDDKGEPDRGALPGRVSHLNQPLHVRGEEHEASGAIEDQEDRDQATEHQEHPSQNPITILQMRPGKSIPGVLPQIPDLAVALHLSILLSAS